MPDRCTVTAGRRDCNARAISGLGSIAVTSNARATRLSVAFPVPAPTSSTGSPGARPESSTIASNTPSGYVGRCCSYASATSPKTRRCSRAISSVVALEAARLGETRETFLDGPRPRLADPFDVVEVVDRRPHDLLQVDKAIDDLLDDLIGQAWDLR